MKRLLLLATILALVISGCGYRLLGDSAGGVERFYIGSVEDRSREPLFGPMVRAELSEGVVERGGGGWLALEVVLHELGEKSRAFVAGDLPHEFLLFVRADIRLTKKGKTLFKRREIFAQREFPAGIDTNATRVNKKRALELLAEDISEDILRHAALGASGLNK